MAKNDLLLLDKLVSDALTSAPSTLDRGAVFERFALHAYLKDFDLSPDEVELGLVDGADDGGIDGWYLFVDGALISEFDDFPGSHKGQTIQVVIVTAKHHDTFQQQAVNNLCVSVGELFDLAIEDSQLTSPFNEEILSARKLLRDVILETAASNPALEFKFAYLSRGDTGLLASNVVARSDLIKTQVRNMFSGSDVRFEYCGSTELLSAYRRMPDFSARARFEENLISRGPLNYVFLCSIPELFRLITDDQGKLKRYLFDANVRDFMGHVPVNLSILRTLENRLTSDVEDFWWLNNGITIVASDAKVVGKEIFLSNVQIVNGLQTTETIYNYFRSARPTHEDRAVLVKVIVAKEKELADKIILATNNQTKVDQASLRATDKIQRDIEDLLFGNGWFYDRRRNYYLNAGRPSNRIVSITYMSNAVLAVLLQEPHKCNRARPKYLLDDRQYERIFNVDLDLRLFLAALEICKGVEGRMVALKMSDDVYGEREYTQLYRFHYAALYALTNRGARYVDRGAMIAAIGQQLSDSKLHSVHSEIVAARGSFLSARIPRPKRLHRSEEFWSYVMKAYKPTSSVG